MLRLSLPLLLSWSLGLVLCSAVMGQNQTSLGDAARQAEAAKSAASDKAEKVKSLTKLRMGKKPAQRQPDRRKMLRRKMQCAEHFSVALPGDGILLIFARVTRGGGRTTARHSQKIKFITCLVPRSCP